MMQPLDKERKFRIAELVITIKLMSLVFFCIAIFIEIPKIFTQRTRILNMDLSMIQYQSLIAGIFLVVLFSFSLIIIRYYKRRYLSTTGEERKQTVFDIVEICLFIMLYSSLIVVSGLSASPYKFIYFFIMISATIQHGLKKGMVVSSVCAFILLAIDIIADPDKPNMSFQIDLILAGVFLMITWLVGYYRSVEAHYSERMANLAKLDDLTGLYSHGYFQINLSDQIKSAKRNGKNLSLMFVDIDSFKYFNDLYGHQEGDRVLKHIGAIIKNLIHEPNSAARYGGEEFTVLMYDAPEEVALNLAELLRSKIEEAFEDKYIEYGKLSVSIGVATYPKTAKSKDELIKYADDALYRAKSFHKNKVEYYQSILEEIKAEIDEDDIAIISSIKTLISIINAKDKYTYRHVERVVILCGLLADELGLSEYDKKILKYSAYLHDIGKINIPKDILVKKMRLTEEEWNLLKQHPADGVEIIAPVSSLEDTIPIILHHHERYGGGGYPAGLKGEEIPYLARVLTVVDSFDAMTSNRPYSIGKTYDEGIKELADCSGTQFDSDIAAAFTKVISQNREIFG